MQGRVLMWISGAIVGGCLAWGYATNRCARDWSGRVRALERENDRLRKRVGKRPRWHIGNDTITKIMDILEEDGYVE